MAQGNVLEQPRSDMAVKAFVQDDAVKRGAWYATQAQSATLTLGDGAQIVDFASGGFGYSHDYVVKQVNAQFDKMGLTTRVFFTPALAEFCVRLAGVLPKRLSSIYPCNAGDEALDGALKIAKGYNPHRRSIAYFAGSSLGNSVSGAAPKELAGNKHQQLFSAFEHIVTPTNDIAQLEALNWGDIAAFVIEPVLCAERIIALEPDLVAFIQQKCRENGALCILNEMACGFGASGPLTYAHHYNDVDVVILGAGLSGGVIPLSAYAAAGEIVDKIYKGKDPALHATTTGANPAACVAGIAALDVFSQENYAYQTISHGRGFKNRLEALAADHSWLIKKVEGLGHLWSLTLASFDDAKMLKAAAAAQGVMLRRPRRAVMPVLQIRAPLMACDEEIAAGLDALERAVGALNI